jgi:hypothetical protein
MFTFATNVVFQLMTFRALLLFSAQDEDARVARMSVWSVSLRMLLWNVSTISTVIVIFIFLPQDAHNERGVSLIQAARAFSCYPLARRALTMRSSHDGARIVRDADSAYGDRCRASDAENRSGHPPRLESGLYRRPLQGAAVVVTSQAQAAIGGAGIIACVARSCVYERQNDDISFGQVSFMREKLWVHEIVKPGRVSTARRRVNESRQMR